MFYVMPYNSRFSVLNLKEIMEVNIFCVKTIKRLSKKNYFIAADPIHCSTNETIRLCNLFKKKGADACSLIFGEKYYSDRQVYEHFKCISKKTNLDLFLHQQEFEKGIYNKKKKHYSINLLNKILSLKNFIGMKEDSKIDIYTNKIVNKFKLKKIILTSGQGKKQWLKFSKNCYGWISGISNIDPFLGLYFYKEYERKNYRICKKFINDFEKPFFKLSNEYGWHRVIKTFLYFQNLMQIHERKPGGKLSRSELSQTKNCFKKMKKISKTNYHSLFFNKP